MKKINKQYHWWIKRRCQLDIKRISRKNKRKNKKLENFSAYNIVIDAPSHFGLLDNHQRHELIKFIKKIRDHATKNHSILINFKKTSKMIADGAILFCSEIERLLEVIKPTPKIRCTVARNDKVSQVLKHIGVYKLLMNGCSVTPKYDDVVKWKKATGRETAGEHYDDIIGHYDGDFEKLLSSKLYVSITEAMTNVSQHAYETPRQDGINCPQDYRRWWMFSQERGDKLSVVFCDLGIGIPSSLPNKRPTLWRRIVGLQCTESEIIKHAVEDSISRTQQSHRGKGLGQIVGSLKQIENSSVIIYSNHGSYRVEDMGKTEQTQNYSDSILGTIIMWIVPLRPNLGRN